MIYIASNLKIRKGYFLFFFLLWTSFTFSQSIVSVGSSSPNGTYTIGQTVDINITFNIAITVSGSPRLLLETGETDSYAIYLSGSGTSTLTFRYTVEENDMSSKLDYISTSSLELNGGSLGSATLSLPDPTPSSKRIKKIVITKNGGGHQTLKAINMIVTPDGGTATDVAITSLANATTTDSHHQNNFGEERKVINLLRNKGDNNSYTFNSPATAEITFNQSYSINDINEFTFYGWARYGGNYYGRIANFSFSFLDDNNQEIYSFTSPSDYQNGSNELVIHRLIGEKGISDGNIWQSDINSHFSSAGYSDGWYVNDYNLPSLLGESLKKNHSILIDGNIVPTITQTDLSANNSTVSVTFSELVYGGTAQSTSTLQTSDFLLSLNGGTATLSSSTPSSISISGTTIGLGISLSGSADGDEILTISPVADSVFDSQAGTASTTQSSNTVNLHRYKIIYLI